MLEIKVTKKHLACIRTKKHKPHASCNLVIFQSQLLRWYKKNKRDNLPWRYTKSKSVHAYEILVSEIMLQQTQVSRVLDKFPQFIHAFPTINHLASAPLENVLKEWQGMGYNRRALYLQKCAQEIIKQFNGAIPSDSTLLKTLPGIGPYTAGAVSCFAFNTPTVFLDTNIRKFFIYHFFAPSRGTDKKISDAEILPIAEKLLYKKNPRVWNYALMDYGALVLCHKSELLPRAKSYHKQSPFLGSNRFFRSQIVQYLLKHKRATFDEL
ncbi:MAG: A/G-specific adenine glycosylase, partial [Patescibacteria group bacterium]